MTSIPRLSKILREIFVFDARLLAREEGVVQRKRTFDGASLAQLLVLGWLHNPAAGPSALARFAGGLGIRISKQGVADRFTKEAAHWLHQLLMRAVQYMVCAGPVSIPMLSRFSAVVVEDGSTISLPDGLAEVWRGCSGGTKTGTQAALKLTVRWDLLRGWLQGPFLQDGRRHESQSHLRLMGLPRGSLWIADVGYFALTWLVTLTKAGVYYLMRYKEPVVVWNEHGQRVDVLDLLPQAHQEQTSMDIDVALGANKQVKTRLLAIRVPEQVVKKRHADQDRYAQQHSTQVSQRQRQLAQWTILITNVPRCLLSLAEALVLIRARWQIELLFKLWKDQGLVDEYQSELPWRVLCEVYAKLLGVLLQHWILIRSCWQDPHRSLDSAAEIVRDQSVVLVHAFAGELTLFKALSMMLKAITNAGCCIPKRKLRPSTSRLLLDGLDWGLT